MIAKCRRWELILLKKIFYLLFVCTHVCVQACEGQKITYRCQFSPSTMWALKIKFSSPDLVASTLTH